METTPKLSDTENSFSSMEYTEPTFYERPEGVNRHLTEVVPQPGETDDDFVARASEELTEQYPDAGRTDKIKMAKKILVAEHQQLDPNYREKQQQHEFLTDEAYRKDLTESRRVYEEELAKIQKEYEDDKNFISEAQKRGLATAEFIQEAESKRQEKLLESRKESMDKWLDNRREAFGRYDARFHERVKPSKQIPEDVERFREREMAELNDQHEKMMNYEATRLGVADSLDLGLALELSDDKFSKETTADSLKDLIGRGLKEGRQATTTEMEDTERFVDKLWQPEIENIKHNAVMRAISNPTRLVSEVGEDGAHDEVKFILPIHNEELISYVAENIQEDKDALALCAGLSDALKYGTNEEAAERADWFYELAHKEAGLDADSILTAVEAMGIARGDHDNRKWGSRYGEFVSRHWDELKQEQPAEQKPDPMEEFTINLGQLRDDLYKKCQDLIASTEFETIHSTRKRNNKNNYKHKKKSESPYGETLSDIILFSRFKNHFSGVDQVIDHISDPVFDIDNYGGTSVTDLRRMKGKWATTDCVVSALEISRPGDIGTIWAYITEGTLHHEQHYYYGLADSLDEIRDLFSGAYYRDRIPGKPNIFDKGAYSLPHWVTPKKLEDNLSSDNGYGDMYALTNKRVDKEYTEIAEDLLIDILAKAADLRSENATLSAGGAEQSVESEKRLAEEPAPQQMSEDYQWSRENAQPTEEPALQKEAAPQISDKDLFNIILNDKKGLSSKGREKVREKNNNLRELARTPRKIMEEMLPESDARKLAQILDENGYEHVKWFDE